jgi:hypothetical protein
MNAKNDKKALELLHTAAAFATDPHVRGHVDPHNPSIRYIFAAANALGETYYHGFLGVQPDHDTALRWWQTAADVKATDVLGVCGAAVRCAQVFLRGKPERLDEPNNSYIEPGFEGVTKSDWPRGMQYLRLAAASDIKESLDLSEADLLQAQKHRLKELTLWQHYYSNPDNVAEGDSPHKAFECDVDGKGTEYEQYGTYHTMWGTGYHEWIQMFLVSCEAGNTDVVKRLLDEFVASNQNSPIVRIFLNVDRIVLKPGVRGRRLFYIALELVDHDERVELLKVMIERFDIAWDMTLDVSHDSEADSEEETARLDSEIAEHTTFMQLPFELLR